MVAALATGLWLGELVRPRLAPAPSLPSYAGLYAGVAPTVVNVGLEEPEARVGSGFAVSPEHVVTARHLVVGAERAVVRTIDGRSLEARVVGTDARTDLALLRTESSTLQPARLGDSEGLAIGDTVLAIGNPYGLGHSLAVGVLGSRGRRFASGEAAEGARYLQLTVPLYPGNSGGPIFDDSGAVVGVLAGTHAQGQSIGFALPVEALRRALPEMASGAQVTRAFLGVRTRDDAEGVHVVAVIPAGPAAKAGIAPGDRIEAVGVRSVRTTDALRAALDERYGEAPVQLRVGRGEESLDLRVRLTDWATTPVVASGMTLAVEPGTGGRVLAVRPRSRAERAGVREGDVIRSIDGLPVLAPADVQELLQGEAGSVEVLRDGVLVTARFE
jgi:S1-C subfamily serine protease